jgi:hypothetical protein
MDINPSDLSEQRTISEQERARRKRYTDYAIASVSLEGFQLSETDLKFVDRYINGEMDLDEFVAIDENDRIS